VAERERESRRSGSQRSHRSECGILGARVDKRFIMDSTWSEGSGQQGLPTPHNAVHCGRQGQDHQESRQDDADDVRTGGWPPVSGEIGIKLIHTLV